MEEEVNLIRILQGVALISWVAVIAVIAYVATRASRGQRLRNGVAMVVLAIVGAAVLNIVAAGLVFIQPQERGVVITVGSGGTRPEPLQPGLNYIIPFAETVVPYSISRQTYTMSIAPSEGALVGDDSIEARTSDGQIVYIDASVIFSIDPTQVIGVHIKWQDNYVDNLVRPVVRGVIRDAVSQFRVDEVVSSQRTAMTDLVTAGLQEKLEEGGLLLVDFVLRNITFSPEYSASVEQKQIAEQLAQQAAFVVDQRKQEAEQARQTAEGVADAAVIEAEGQAQAIVIQAKADAEARLIQAEAEAQALALLADAIAANPDVLTLEYIQKLAPNIQVMLVPTDNPFLLPLPGTSLTTPQ
jgi:regulator of protease activity HflC (stomatin/prohibitin superfamily)